MAGTTGATGASGLAGTTGATGASGLTGATGPSTAINATAVTTGTFYPVFVASGGSDQTPSIRSASTAFSFDAANTAIGTGNILLNKQLQLANNNGGTTTVFYMQYNSANSSVDFIFI